MLLTNHSDEFSKSLAEESLPRRESLRRIGAVHSSDPCKTFCPHSSNKSLPR